MEDISKKEFISDYHILIERLRNTRMKFIIIDSMRENIPTIIHLMKVCKINFFIVDQWLDFCTQISINRKTAYITDSYTDSSLFVSSLVDFLPLRIYHFRQIHSLESSITSYHLFFCLEKRETEGIIDMIRSRYRSYNLVPVYELTDQLIRDAYINRHSPTAFLYYKVSFVNFNLRLRLYLTMIFMIELYARKKAFIMNVDYVKNKII